MRHFLTFFLVFIFSINLSAQDYFTGLIFDDAQYDQSVNLVAQSNVSFQSLPSSATLKQYCPWAGNQIRFGTSVGWAAAWAARTILEARNNNWTDVEYITHNAFSPIFAYQMTRGDNDPHCAVGSKMEEVLYKMKNTGAVRYVDFLEFCPDQVPNNLLVQAKNNSITDYNKLFERDSDIEYRLKAVKKSLSEGFPVVIGMYCPPSFLNAKEFWQPRELVTNSTPGHAVCIVGYDDNKFGGAFEVMNSWGRKWGVNGFTWIRYDDFADYVKYAFEIILLDEQKEQVGLFGSARIVNDDDREYTASLTKEGFYQLYQKFQIGDRFRINIRDCSRGYFYIMGSGAQNDFSLLFPYDEKLSAGLVYDVNNLSIPDEQHFIQVTGNEKEDYLYLIFSREPLDTGFLLEKLTSENGESVDILYKVLGNRIIPAEDIEWDQYNMTFKTNGDRGDIALMIIKFNRQ